MTTTIKIENGKKEKLDKFLASLLLKEGIKVSLQVCLANGQSPNECFP